MCAVPLVISYESKTAATGDSGAATTDVTAMYAVNKRVRACKEIKFLMGTLTYAMGGSGACVWHMLFC